MNVDKRSAFVLPKPDEKFSRMLHLADYLASRKCLIMKFENYEVNEEIFAQEFDPETTFTFGKYKGEKMLDVYNSHPDYFAWMEENIRKHDIQNTIKAMKQYLSENTKGEN